MGFALAYGAARLSRQSPNFRVISRTALGLWDNALRDYPNHSHELHACHSRSGYSQAAAKSPRDPFAIDPSYGPRVMLLIQVKDAPRAQPHINFPRRRKAATSEESSRNHSPSIRFEAKRRCQYSSIPVGSSVSSSCKSSSLPGTANRIWRMR